MLKKIKSFLGRFLPLPSNSAHRMNKILIQHIEMLQDEVIKINERVNEQERGTKLFRVYPTIQKNRHCSQIIIAAI